jgi:type IV pilus assembly protein PilA
MNTVSTPSDRTPTHRTLTDSLTMHRTPDPRPTEAGFTLVELLIVMSVILILMTLAIPAMQKTIKRANETSAIQSLRDLDEMEGQYSSTYPQHGFACSLVELGGKTGSGAPSADAAQLINEDLASGHKSGYTFTVTCGAKTTNNNVDQYNSYEITAVPNSIGHTGDRGFCTDADGQIRYDTKGGTNCTDLLQ